MKRIDYLKVLIVILGLIGLGQAAHADDNAVHDAINDYGDGASGPTISGNTLGSIAQGMENGNTSPLYQYLATNEFFTQCATGVVNDKIGQRDSYNTAMTKWTGHLCAMYDCYKQAYLLSMLSVASPNPQNGGTSDNSTQCTLQKSIQSLAMSPPPSGLNCGGGQSDFAVELLGVINQNANTKCN
jgi:hypothetical protein